MRILPYLALAFFLTSCGSNKTTTSGGVETSAEDKMTEVTLKEGKAQITIDPFVGAVTPTSGTFMVKGQTGDKMQIQLSTNDNFKSSMLSDAVTADEFGYAKILVSGLKPNTTYYYRAVQDSTAAASVASFRTFPDDEDYSFTVGFGSCQQSGYNQWNPVIFPVIAKDTLRTFIQIGDWTYPDQQLGRDYTQTFSKVERSWEAKYDMTYPFVSQVLTKFPIAHIYDDHDYGRNEGDGTLSGKANSLEGYKRFFPHYTLGNPDAGIWQKFTIGNTEFFLLDLRSQRTPNKQAFDASGDFNPPPGHSILAGYDIQGENQRQWLEKSLKESKAKWKVIVSTVIFNPKYYEALQNKELRRQLGRYVEGLSDKWGGFPEDINFLVNTIKDNDIKNVIVFSGDSHSSYIDDGTNSVIPEISCSNIDVDNTNIGLLAALAGFNIWNKGTYTGNGRCYGRVTFTPDHVLMQIVDDKGTVVTSYQLNAR